MMSERMWRILYGAVNEQTTDLPVLLDKLQHLITKTLDEGFLLLAERPRDILNHRMSHSSDIREIEPFPLISIQNYHFLPEYVRALRFLIH